LYLPQVHSQSFGRAENALAEQAAFSGLKYDSLIVFRIFDFALAPGRMVSGEATEMPTVSKPTDLQSQYLTPQILYFIFPVPFFYLMSNFSNY